MLGFRKPARPPSPIVSTIDEVMIISRLTVTLAKGMCLAQEATCTCKVGDRVRCHAVRRYAGLMLPIARHLFNDGEYRHDD
jgi:hypothetical protein